MNAFTQKQMASLYAAMAKTYGVEAVTKSFSIEPALAQRLQDKIVEQSQFLPLINVIGVDEIKGQVILGGVTGPVSGRTNTDEDGKERTTHNVLGLESMTYELFATESDVHIGFNTLDAWAKFPDFYNRYTANVQRRIANDRELVGWNGTEAAKNTDLKQNPLLQDVNKGWMQIARELIPANVLTEGTTKGELRIGKGGDFENLDHAVTDMLQGIPDFLRTGLIVLVGSDLVAQESLALFKKFTQPTEKVGIAAALSTFGGLDWMTPSNFPSRGLVITSLDNLSVYHQSSSWRRYLREEPKKNRIADYNSRNEGYVIEELRKFVAAEFKNVKIPNRDSSAWV